MNWEGVGRKRSWPNFKAGLLSRGSPRGAEENNETVSQDSQSQGRDLNPRPPEHKAGVLTTRP
jgi:hypothetical protein